MPVKQKSTTTNHGSFKAGWLGDFEVHTCGTCGISFGVPLSLMEQRRMDGKGWSCPNGHTWFYTGEDEEEKAKRLLKAERDRSARLAAQLDQTEASRSALKGVVTKQRNKLERVSKGVCPCCNRSFADLRKHMKTKHPSYDGQPQ
jgi:hypothetical protein